MKFNQLISIVGLATALCLSSTYAMAKTSTMKGNMPTKTHKVPGIAAWSAAKSNGFKFFPDGDRGNQDGVGATGRALCKEGNEWKTRYSSQMVGGVNMIVNKPDDPRPLKRYECYGLFNLFAGKKLAMGWKIKSMRFSGTHELTSKRWRPDTAAIETVVKVNRSLQQNGASKAMLKEIILEGPANQSWQKAFDVN